MIIPQGPKLLLRPLTIQENDQVYAAAKRAGIELAGISERKEQAHVDKGVVIAIGPTVDKVYFEGKVGDVIGFAKYGGKFITDHYDNSRDPELFLIINDEDVICTFTE